MSADEDTGESRAAADRGRHAPAPMATARFEVLADGNWTYTLNNSHPAVQALAAGADAAATRSR